MKNIITTQCAYLTAAQEINGLHVQICQHALMTLDLATRIGELLTVEKARSKHGEWLPWLSANVSFSQSQAWRYMKLYEQRDNIKLCAANNLKEAFRLLSDTQAEPAKTTNKLEPPLVNGKPYLHADGTPHVNERKYWHPFTESIPWGRLGNGNNKRMNHIEHLTQSVKNNGLYIPITLYDGNILDGRAKYTACCRANVPARYIKFEGSDPLMFLWESVMPKLTEDQRAIIAIWIYELKEVVDFVKEVDLSGIDMTHNDIIYSALAEDKYLNMKTDRHQPCELSVLPARIRPCSEGSVDENDRAATHASRLHNGEWQP